MRTWRAAAVYVVAAVTLTYPLAFELTTSLGAPHGPGEPFLNLYLLGWALRAWTTNPRSVLTGEVFNTNVFHPAEGALAYPDNFLLQALALTPIYVVTDNIVLCYNVLLLASIALSGLAMHSYARAVTGTEFGAYVAGLAWACWPYRTAHLMQLPLQALYFMPLALLCLHRIAAKRRWRDALGLAVVVTLQFAASVENGVMTAVALAISGGALAAVTGQWRSTRWWSRVAAAAVLAVLLNVPIAGAYFRSQQYRESGRVTSDAARQSASLSSYAQVPPVNLLYGTTRWLASSPVDVRTQGRSGPEHQMFPGFVLLGLAAYGFARHVRSDTRAVAITGGMLVAGGALLSFGPGGWPWLYATLHDVVPGLAAVRAPARFSVVVVFGLALLAAVGTRALRVSAIAPWMRAALIALLGVEYVNAPLPLVAAPPLRSGVGQWLANEPTPGPVVFLPLDAEAANSSLMVQSLEHGRPLVNGYGPQPPASYSSVIESMADFPSPTAFAMLRELDVRFIVSRGTVAGAADARSPLVERARVDGSVIYEVRWSAESLAALEELAAPAPPPPGDPPFTSGEVATYDIYWDGGPLDVPAGTATMIVINGEPGSSRWEFETRATSAAWVSTFFQADDRFVTVTDSTLLPITHTREIREGRRNVDRKYAYDRASNLIHTNTMTLPLGSPAARDFFSALYYLRTLSLTPGSIVVVPINEAGSSLVVQVAVAEVEDIEQGGQRVPALRLEPRVMRQLEPRRPMAITLWLSADERRVPVRAFVDAGFGRIRLELKEHRR